MSSGDAKFFTSHKKGEIAEWRDEVANPDKDKKKDAVKKVIAAMTVGKDVSMLFTDIVNCMQTDNVELKKLVYLYLINYAKTQPDLAILAVNTFVKDTQDPNPLIRALAVRTMGCIRVNKITEYLCDPLQRTLAVGMSKHVYTRAPVEKELRHLSLRNSGFIGNTRPRDECAPKCTVSWHVFIYLVLTSSVLC
mmetsp:Transcript_24592/g.60428  ORF Transcript_24592/g.60428 Transcript_24592/m.60428 type:complete len:193 (-) Transcript_24592:3179-3757(-)